MVGNGNASSLVQKELSNGQTRASQANNQNFFVMEVFHEPYPLVIKDIGQYVGRLVIKSLRFAVIWANARR
jgi:hypothetical protein